MPELNQSELNAAELNQDAPPPFGTPIVTGTYTAVFAAGAIGGGTL